MTYDLSGNFRELEAKEDQDKMCPWPDLNITDRFTPRPWLSVLPPAAAAAAAATSGNLMSER